MTEPIIIRYVMLFQSGMQTKAISLVLRPTLARVAAEELYWIERAPNKQLTGWEARDPEMARQIKEILTELRNTRGMRRQPRRAE